MKKLPALLLAALMLLMAATPVAPLAADEIMKDAGINYTEATAMLPNPFMGYPNRGYAADGGFLMQEGGASTIHVAGEFPGGFTWYYIDLKAFSAGNDGGPGTGVGGIDKPISQAALDGFEQALLKTRRNGGSVFMRFVYDTRGVAGCEPNNFDMVITHLEQLCAVVSKFPDIVQGFECGVIGVYGEMHSSKYGGKAYVNRVIDAYLDNTPDSMVLLLRSAPRIADYLGITVAQLAEYVPEPGSRAWRLGYYNDGYMNSDSDLGTWTYNRALETNYLARGNTPYGGEYGSAYDWIIQSSSTAHLPQNAIPEMYRTHVSFMRGNVYSRNKPSGGKNTYFGYDDYPYTGAYEKPWYPDNSAFKSGADCFDFITAHIGYRLVLRESRLSESPQAGGTLTLRGRIENTGFANVLHKPNAEILLVKDGAVYACDVKLDAFDLKSCTTYNYDFSLFLPNSLAGDYDVYLRLSHVDESFYAKAKSGIQFANNGGIFDEKLGANRLGTVTVAPAENAGSAASDVFAQTNAPQAGAKLWQGAPALLCHGFGIGARSISLSYNAGDDIKLSSLNLLRSDAAATYQWRKDGSVISSQPELLLTNIAAADAGSYQLTVISGSAATTMMVHISVAGHSFSPWETKQQPTCSSTGLAARACLDGGCILLETKVLPALAHVPGGAPRTVPPTCAALGRTEYPCALCGATLGFTLLDLPKPPHVLGAPYAAYPSTCTQEGERAQDCVNCPYIKTQPIPALHPFDITLNGNTASALCPVCGVAKGPVSLKGPMPGDILDTAPVPFGTDKLVLVGEGGFAPLYEVKSGDAFHITLLFKVTGVESPVTLTKLRAHTYTDQGIRTDSNNAANYHTHLSWPVTQEGYWAYTMSRNVMSWGASGSYFGGIDYFAFFDPSSTKGPEPVNGNQNAAFQLAGIFDGWPEYNIIFLGADGGALEWHSGAYNHLDNTWVNYIAYVKTADELYQGPVPTKASDGEYSYAFAGWADADEKPIGPVIMDVIAYPSFTATPITTQPTTTSAPTTTTAAPTTAITQTTTAAPTTTRPPAGGTISKSFDVLSVRGTGKIACEGATSFASSDKSVADVDNRGNILGKRPGSTVITATTPAGQEMITVTVKYSLWQWPLVIFLFGWIWLPLK